MQYELNTPTDGVKVFTAMESGIRPEDFNKSPVTDVVYHTSQSNALGILFTFEDGRMLLAPPTPDGVPFMHTPKQAGS